MDIGQHDPAFMGWYRSPEVQAIAENFGWQGLAWAAWKERERLLLPEAPPVEPVAPEQQFDQLPPTFRTGIEARAHPGYIDDVLAHRIARDIVERHPGSVIIPIGSYNKSRGYAVIQPQPKAV